MRDDSRNYVLVGSFVIAMVVALLVWIAMLTGRTGATDDYYVVYSNVMGLKTGVQILYEGYPVGLIDEIGTIERDGRQHYRVDVSVKRGWPIPEDSVAAITAPGLLSSVVLDIRAGSSSTLLEPGSEIPGQEAADIFSAVNEAAAQIVDLIDKELAPLVSNVGETAPKLLDNLESFTEDLNEAVGQVNAILGPVNVERIGNILGNLDSTSGDLNSLINDLGETRAELSSVIRRVDQLMNEDEGQVGQAVADLNQSLAAVARHIDAIAANLEETTRNMNEFSKQIRENPAVILRGRETGDGS